MKLCGALQGSCVVAMLLCSLLGICESVPIPQNKDPDISQANEEYAVNFSKKPGYSLNSFEKSDLIKASTNLQKFGEISVTGQIDEVTPKSMKRTRCSLPDTAAIHNRTRRFVIGGTRWTKRIITYKIVNYPPTLTREEVSMELKKAYKPWGDYSRLQFVEVTDDADVEIGFFKGEHGDQFPFDGPGQILAHAFLPNSGSSRGGDIHFDIEENWTVGITENGTCFRVVAGHEIGHTLGLHHSDYSNAVMNPDYNVEPGNEFHLSRDEIAAIYELYVRGNITQEKVDNSSINYFKYTTTTVAPPVTSTKKVEIIPDQCEGNYDSVALLRGEIFVFKGAYMWRLTDMGRVTRGYPTKTQRIFNGIKDPEWHIDAAYERADGNLVFFTGDRYWVYDGAKFIEDSPRPLNQLGLPNNVKKIDAAHSAHNRRREIEITYLYSGYNVWKIHGSSNMVVRPRPGYFKLGNLDAALTTNDGVTYYFKGRTVWKAKAPLRIDLKHPNPKSASELLFGCKK